VKPNVKLSSVKRAGGRHPAVLMCSAYEFYPQHIKVSWLRDGKEVTSDVTSTMEMADGDWYYQIHSELEYTPKSGEKISCVVEHASFNKPMIYDWGRRYSHISITFVNGIFGHANVGSNRKYEIVLLLWKHTYICKYCNNVK